MPPGSTHASVLQRPITAVWIDVGCIACNACMQAAPEVFHVTAWTAQIRGQVRMDGRSDENPDHVGLAPAAIGLHDSDMTEAAAACPVAVIRFDQRSSTSG